MSKKIKALELDALRGSLKGARDFVLLEPLKVDAATDYQFRKTLREKKIRVQMVKNSYAKKVFGEMGLNAGDVWAAPTLLCYGGSSIKELATTVTDAVKATRKDPKQPEKIKVKAGVADGQPTPVDVMEKMPTREEALGAIVSLVLAPGANLLAAITGPGGTLGAVVKAIEMKAKEGGGAPAAEAPAADAAPVAG